MTENFLEKLFEHNTWANLRLIEVCCALSDAQLDAEPQSVTKGTIRRTLVHLLSSQQGYLRTLTLPLEERLDSPTVAFAELQESASKSGEGLLALAKGEQKPLKPRLQTRDGYFVEPWVLMVQIINHATEHREQINSMLSALGVTPPDLDGWGYGEATNALIPIST
ncbi:MAG: DinB family protein [Anaerolineales bacterium]